jgi:hypothetical protein
MNYFFPYIIMVLTSQQQQATHRESSTIHRVVYSVLLMALLCSYPPHTRTPLLLIVFLYLVSSLVWQKATKREWAVCMCVVGSIVIYRWIDTEQC